MLQSWRAVLARFRALLRSDAAGVRAGFYALLLSSGGDLIAGLTLGSITGTLESLPGLLGFGRSCAIEILRPRSAGLWMTKQGMTTLLRIALATSAITCPMKLRTLAAALLVLLPLAAFADDPPSTNPFFEKSPLPFQAPPFDRIKDGDFQPAIEEGMKRELAEVAHDPNAVFFYSFVQARAQCD